MTESDTDTVSLYAFNSKQFPEGELPPQRTHSGRTGGCMRGICGRGRAPVTVPRRGRNSRVSVQRNSSLPPRDTLATNDSEIRVSIREIHKQLATLTSTVQLVSKKNQETGFFSPESRRVTATYKHASRLRDLSPISDAGSDADIDTSFPVDFASARNLKKQNESAEKFLENLPANIHNQLPPVAQNSLFKLLNEKHLVNLNDLLPKNRTPGPSSGEKTLCANSMGVMGLSTLPSTKLSVPFQVGFVLFQFCR